MKQVVQSARSGKLAVNDVPAPKAGAGEIAEQQAERHTVEI